MEKSSLKYLLATFLISTSLCSFAADENSASGAGMPNNATLPSITPNETSPNPSFLPPSNETSPNPNFVLPSNETSANPKTDVVTPTSESEQESDNLNLEVGDNTADIANSHVANLENLSATQGETIMKLAALTAEVLSPETMDEIVKKTLDLKKDSVPESARDFFNADNEKLAEFLRLNPDLNDQINLMVKKVEEKNWSTNRENSGNGRFGYIHTLVAEQLESSKAQIRGKIERFQKLMKADTPYPTIESELGPDFITQLIALDKSDNGALKILYQKNKTWPSVGITGLQDWKTVKPALYTFESKEKRQEAYVDASKVAFEYLNTQGFVLPQSAEQAPTIAEQVLTMSPEQIAANLDQISVVSDANSASGSTQPAAGAASGGATPEQPVEGSSAQQEGVNPNPTAPEIDPWADPSRYDPIKRMVQDKLTPEQRAQLSSIENHAEFIEFLRDNPKVKEYLLIKTNHDLIEVQKRNLTTPGLYTESVIGEQFAINATALVFFAEGFHKGSIKEEAIQKRLKSISRHLDIFDSTLPSQHKVSIPTLEKGSDKLKDIKGGFELKLEQILSSVRFDKRLADVRKRFGRPPAAGGGSGSGTVFGTSAAESALHK